MTALDPHQRNVSESLTLALKRAEEREKLGEITTLDINQDKLIIFSDLHKGTRDGADDFRFSERAYNAALAYYYHQGYIMASLGDVEELWENRRGPVFDAYERTLVLEGKFHQQNRLWRFWGNHDDNWRYPKEVRKQLERVFGGGPLEVHAELLVQVMDGDKPLGRLFMVHGHQGTLDSERFPAVARFFVRNVWRPIQRVTRISSTTPAKDWKLRQSHNIALYNWSEAQSDLVLIAGHTHQPVFQSMTHEAKLQELIAQAEADHKAQPADKGLLDNLSHLSAELEWVRAQRRQATGAAGQTHIRKPCYFNTGCCSFSDGDITGLEIANGRIALVKWPNSERKPRPRVLESASLADIFEAVTG